MENQMSVISQFSSGGVKSVQSGVATIAGTTTITAVSTSKSVVYSISKGSLVVNSSIESATPASTTSSHSISVNINNGEGGGGPISMPAYNVPGRANNITAKQYSAKLTNSTTITVDGPCEWQVVEYY